MSQTHAAATACPQSALARPRRSGRLRRVQFEIDDPSADDSLAWGDFVPSESKSLWPEITTSLSCSLALLWLFGRRDSVGLPLGIVLTIFAAHALLLLLLTGMRTCMRTFGPGLSGLKQFVRSLFH